MTGAHGGGRRGGFTLIEFVFACSVMAFVALGVAGMFPSALRSVVSGGQVTKATVLAQAMINMIGTEPFDNIYPSPSSGNGYTGYSAFDTSHLPAACPAGSGESCRNKLKWKADLLADTAQSSGRGLPGGFGTVTVRCLSVTAAVPYALGTGTCGAGTNFLEVSVSVHWDRSGSQSVNLVMYVARIE